MSAGSLIAVIFLAVVAGIILFNVGAGSVWLGRRFRNWRLGGYRVDHNQWGIRENAGGILLTVVMVILILAVS